MPRNSPRKKKDPDALRTKAIPGRLSIVELNQVLARAEGNVADYCRRAVLGKHRPPPAPEVNRLIYLELGKISNHLNQLIQSIQQGLPIPTDLTDLEVLKQQISQIRIQLLGIDRDDWEAG